MTYKKRCLQRKVDKLQKRQIDKYTEFISLLLDAEQMKTFRELQEIERDLNIAEINLRHIK